VAGNRCREVDVAALVKHRQSLAVREAKMSNAEFGILFFLVLITLELWSINSKLGKFMPDDKA
jgi:hypothetical protein